jgi:TPR repeat protein
MVVSDDPDARPVSAICPQCGRRADILSRRYRHWFTLFFLPLFPISRPKPFSQCSQCGAQFPLEPRQLGNQVAASQQQTSQRAIALYNSLHTSPANSITLNELMGLYASMQEYDQAISAARQFPQALESSEQCMVTLGRLYLAKDDHAEAIRWFDRALARNEAQAEAHYFKGVAQLTGTPPDYATAVASARSARIHGHPEADELLREAESRAR